MTGDALLMHDDDDDAHSCCAPHSKSVQVVHYTPVQSHITYAGHVFTPVHVDLGV